MCDPISATMELALGGSMVSAIGGYQQMKSQQAIAAYNANAERDAGYQNEIMFRDQAQFDLARQAATFSSRGVSSTSGSPLLLMAQSAKNKQLDALNIRRNALNAAAGQTALAQEFGAAAPLTAAGDLLGGASRAAGPGGSNLSALGFFGGGAGGVGPPTIAGDVNYG